MVDKEEGKTRKPSHSTFKDAIGGGEFHPDIERIELKDILNTEVLIREAQILEEFTSKFGVHDCILMLIELENGAVFTTITSGMVVIKRVAKAMREGLLPLYGTITYNGTYYNIL